MDAASDLSLSMLYMAETSCPIKDGKCEGTQNEKSPDRQVILLGRNPMRFLLFCVPGSLEMPGEFF